ncbi:hypothetical protein Bca4012_023058 [Brassica carinata]
MGESGGEMGKIAGEIGGEIGGEIQLKSPSREMENDVNDFEKGNSTFPIPNRGSPRNVTRAAKDALVKLLN